MPAPNPDSFERALVKFKASLSPSLAQQFSVCTLQDVRQVVRDIQLKQGREGKLRYMRRLEAFVEAMEQLGQVMEVFLNANVFVCFIWGPIKFFLVTTNSHLDSFDKLLGIYSQVGDAIPGLVRYKATFERHSTLAAVLEDYYSDILRLHHEALSVFNRPRWKTVFDATWKTFGTRFNPILQSLIRRRDLLESEKASASLDGIQMLRDEIRHHARVSRIKEKLQAPNYHLDQEISTEDRYGGKSGQWIFREPEFRSWLDISSPGHKVLYVNGIPGAGKTTLMSSVIERLLDEIHPDDAQKSFAYFYFKQGQPDKDNFNQCC
ncbi:zinc finger protein [Hirsutella rhossiliensis]|uniref:Zinc finger protein n=1 Tax=Hirsutella rhossiliensis TaxID=111463 RepID=A0A9P8MN54_9HYPO|nr:zinc finger protein [Hirsutella rhossiliensis]KAH0958140.1 zinc finger protein [Hirsutella rhossiliensis]